ncbi:hypothetical protein FIE12Z_6702 [Fusarium flagelliforme]|uniref:Uncharacterized protein n=1 Tax=Fusarium flagelliforme TaxID=2675880 RepID=A0A395MMC7_9HYPO|nr:hypothetical protein FIE12Z_6702 [Fusarium flagelliforme]
MSVCIGYIYFLDKNEIPDYLKLTPALDDIFGEGKVRYEIIDKQLILKSETEDLDGLRDKLREKGVTSTWEEFVATELN